MKKGLTVVLIMFAMFVVFFINACTDAPNARKILSQQGFTNIETTGYTFFGCSEDDLRHTGFTATAQDGSTVQGVVCQGFLLKGATIRFK